MDTATDRDTPAPRNARAHSSVTVEVGAFAPHAVVAVWHDDDDLSLRLTDQPTQVWVHGSPESIHEFLHDSLNEVARATARRRAEATEAFEAEVERHQSGACVEADQ